MSSALLVRRLIGVRGFPCCAIRSLFVFCALYALGLLLLARSVLVRLELARMQRRLARRAAGSQLTEVVLKVDLHQFSVTLNHPFFLSISNVLIVGVRSLSVFRLEHAFLCCP